MSRLDAALQRLFLLPHAEQPGLIDPSGRVRALVLELARPAEWTALAAVWQGVQADLSLPAPAIAVSGVDGYQLWFSLVEPIAATQAAAFLAALRERYLNQIAPHRVRCLPETTTAEDGAAIGPTRHAELVPAQHGPQAHWSAFVAADLAPMFADEPWLDMPPGADGQADLLSALTSIKPSELAHAMAILCPQAAPVSDKPANRPLAAANATLSTDTSPRQFLLDVMRNEAIEMALRIDAAKALLPYTERHASSD